MDILLTDLKGTTHVWRVNPTDTIEQLQERYNDFDKSDQDRQLSFIYAGRLLEQNKTLGSYGIVKFSRIHAMYQIKGGAPEAMDIPEITARFVKNKSDQTKRRSKDIEKQGPQPMPDLPTRSETNDPPPIQPRVSKADKEINVPVI